MKHVLLRNHPGPSQKYPIVFSANLMTYLAQNVATNWAIQLSDSDRNSDSNSDSDSDTDIDWIIEYIDGVKM